MNSNGVGSGDRRIHSVFEANDGVRGGSRGREEGACRVGEEENLGF
jgi:hypothetical protein